MPRSPSKPERWRAAPSGCVEDSATTSDSIREPWVDRARRTPPVPWPNASCARHRCDRIRRSDPDRAAPHRRVERHRAGSSTRRRRSRSGHRDRAPRCRRPDRSRRNLRADPLLSPGHRVPRRTSACGHRADDRGQPALRHQPRRGRNSRSRPPVRQYRHRLAALRRGRLQPRLALCRHQAGVRRSPRLLLGGPRTVRALDRADGHLRARRHAREAHSVPPAAPVPRAPRSR